MTPAPTPDLRIDLQLCDGCGRCVDACAPGALALIDGQVALIRPRACDDTALCELACPTGAIQLPMRVVGPATHLPSSANPAQGDL